MSKLPDVRDEAITLADPHDPAQIRRMIQGLDGIRTDLFQLLRSTAIEKLTVRPESKRWSALEHLRHLVFAEDLYINRWILRNDTPFSALGHLPAFLRGRPGFEVVGTKPSSDLENILGEWTRIHELTISFVSEASSADLKGNTSDIDFGQGNVGHVLQGMGKHDFHHILKIEEAIASVA